MKLKTRPGYLSKLGASLLVSVVALTASACSSSEAGQTTELAEGTHAVTHEFGETTVPDDLGRIVSLDEYAALGLLAVGITPDVVFTSWGSEIGQDILASAGTEVVTVPPLGAPPIEQVLAQDPGLVIFTSMGDRNYYDSIESTVPTVPVPAVTTPWRENLAFFGRAFDRQSVADKLTGALEGKISDVSARSRGEANTVSVLMSSSGILATTTEQAPPSLLLAESGFGRPESQRANAAGGLPYAPLSDEAIPAQDARIVAVFDEGVYEFGKVASVPGFSSLSAAQENRVAKVNGDMWLATHPFATFWMIEDMDAMADGNLAGTGTESVAARRYQEFTALTA